MCYQEVVPAPGILLMIQPKATQLIQCTQISSLRHQWSLGARDVNSGLQSTREDLKGGDRTGIHTPTGFSFLSLTWWVFLHCLPSSATESAKPNRLTDSGRQ